MELKPCPFCGCKKIHSYVIYDYCNLSSWKVCCERCAAQIHREMQSEAEAAWNGRKADV